MRILYVEDNADDVELTILALKKQAPAFTVDTAATIAEARAILLGTTQYDLLLVDLRLPDGSGLDLLIEVRKQALPIAVVILTGSGNEETAVSALRVGADDYLTKSTNYRDHLATVIKSAWTRFQAEFAQKKGQLRVLYVEHYSADTDLTTHHLNQFAPHIHLSVINTAEETLALLSKSPDYINQFDLLLLDYRLPGISGLELIKQLRDEHQITLPMVIITGQGNEEIAIQALRLGAADYLVKRTGYLHKLPVVLENAFHQAKLIQEQQALRESEARFRRMAENAPDIIFRLRLFPARQYEYVSSAATHITGYTPEEFYADPNLGIKIVHPEDTARLEASDRGENPFDNPLEIRWIHKNGDIYWTEQRSVPIYDKDNRLIAIEGISRDITNRKKTEEEIRLQSAALNTAANAIIITDPDGLIQWANPAFLTLSGYSKTEILGKKPGELINSGMHDELFFRNMWETILSGNVWHGELINRRKEGELYSEKMTISSLKDETGKISHFIAIKQDISERKQTEEDRGRLLTQVREQANRIQNIMDTVPEGLLLINNEGRILSANPTAKNNLAVLTGKPEPDYLTHLGNKPLTELLTKQQTAGWHDIDVEDRHYSIIVRAMEYGPESDYWVIAIKDMTEDRIRQRYQQAQERLATVGQLAAGIAHDFNNVMGVIILYARMLREIPDLSEMNQKHLDLISDRAQHATDLITQILDFSRKSVMEMTPLNLRSFIKGMIKLLKQTLPENIESQMRYDQNEYIIQADPTRLQQVIMNLALNARDAMPDGGQLQFMLSSFSVTKEHAPPLPDMDEGRWVKLEIIDTGSGIAPEHLPRLFEPFFSTKAPNKGTGLGLAQVYGIVKQHGGSIFVDSQLGAGTTFTIFFPLLNTPTAPSRAVLADEFAPEGNETILLVEDNPAMRQAVSDSLNKLGYQILTATNGIEAVDIFIKHKESIHLVISDLIMPEMGGMDLYRELQKLYPAIKMLIMTGYGGDLINHEFLHQEGIAFIQKPFNLTNLAKLVRTQLGETV